MNNISNPGQQKSKREQPKKQVTFYGYRRQNNYDYVSSSSQVIIRYNIFPVGLGKLQYLRSKVQMILGKKECITSSNQINPFFQYAIKRVLYFEAISGIKKTNYIQILLNQLADGVNKSAQKKIQELIESFLEKIKQKDQQIEKIQLKRIKKYMKYESKMNQQKKEIRMRIKESFLKKHKVQQSKKFEDIEHEKEYQRLKLEVDQIFRNIDSLQPLKVSQSFLKYSIFQKRYKGFYDIQLKLERRDAKPYFIIRINRLSKQIEPVLQNMINLVQQRAKDVDYRAQTRILVKDIFGQVKRFHNNNSNQNKNNYVYLSPQTILFDQIALVPKLSYQPLLLHTFGLKNRPMSSQNRICFNPSPRSFDYFKSLPQYDKQIICMLDDPLYGNKQIYQNDIHRLSTLQKQNIGKQQQFLSLKMEQIVVWRMILLSYYLSNSEQYGLCPQILFTKKQQHHKSMLQTLQKNVIDDCSNLNHYLGIEQNNNNVGKFQFSMSRLCDFLQPQKQNDSIIQALKDANIKRYFQWRNDLIKEIVRLLVNDCLFGKVYNVKKYIIIYLILAIEIFQEYNYLARLEDKQSKQNKDPEGSIRNRKYFKGFLQVQIKRLKGDKSHIAYQSSTYNKIIQYGQARKNNDAQAKYVKQDQIGRILFQYIKQLHVQIKLFYHLNDTLNQLQLRESLTESQHKQYRQTIKDIQNVAQRSLKIAKDVLGQFIYNQLKLKHRQGPHKISSDANNQVRQFFSLNTQRLDIVSLIYLNFDESKLIAYDTLILPQFNLQQYDRKIQIPKTFDFIPVEVGKLNLIGELVDIGRMQPKKMTYLVNKGDTLFGEIEKGKKQLLFFEKNTKN